MTENGTNGNVTKAAMLEYVQEVVTAQFDKLREEMCAEFATLRKEMRDAAASTVARPEYEARHQWLQSELQANKDEVADLRRSLRAAQKTVDNLKGGLILASVLLPLLTVLVGHFLNGVGA